MNLKKLAPVVFVCMLVTPGWGQGKAKNLLKAAEKAISRQTAKQALAKQVTTRHSLAKQAVRSYHPVFGYRPFTIEEIKKHGLIALQGPWTNKGTLLQVAPALDAENISAGFEQVDRLRPGQVVQAVYLWRLANPGKSLKNEFLALFSKASYLLEETLEYARKNEIPGMADDYPAVKLLTYLLDDTFEPLSYAQMLAKTSVYPKHVVLNEDNFPVPTAQAQEAEQLDAYLMLAIPSQMGPFNNLNGWQKYKSKTHRGYYKFVLTPEEKQAANQLVALRKQAYQIAPNPTARELIERAYNELESHAFPYSQLSQGTLRFHDEVYPNYRNTPLFRAVDKKLTQLKAQGLMRGDPEFANYVHLIVLNGMMGGVSLRNYRRLNELLWAFKTLCGITKNTEFNIQHLYHLQQALQSKVGIWAFGDMPFVVADLQKELPEQSVEQLEELRWWMHELLEKENVRNLIGKEITEEE